MSGRVVFRAVCDRVKRPHVVLEVTAHSDGYRVRYRSSVVAVLDGKLVKRNAMWSAPVPIEDLRDIGMRLRCPCGVDFPLPDVESLVARKIKSQRLRSMSTRRRLGHGQTFELMFGVSPHEGADAGAD